MAGFQVIIGGRFWVITEGVTGASLFDFQIIATMLGNGLTRVYTYNRSDFEKVHEIDVLTP